MKTTMKFSLLLISINLFIAVNLFAQTPPLVYTVENTGASFPEPVMIDDLNQLPFIQQLPDPFAWADGSGRSTSFNNWEKRRNEIKAQFEHYEIGTKPNRPENITASFADNTLTVVVTVNGKTLTLTSRVVLPEGDGPFPAIIGMNSGTGSLPASVFTSRNIAQITFSHNNVTTYGSPKNTDPYYTLYPELNVDNTGQYSAWAWGVSRLIDGIEIALADKIDISHLAVTGCSYAGKMALFAGAFDERIALTISEESGGGGYTAWRVSQTLGAVENLGATDYNWFREDMRRFAGSNVPKLPVDHHELMAMVAPRALLVLGNEGQVWLADRSGYVASRAAKKVYEEFGIGDRFGMLNTGGHNHCAFPAVELPYLESFVEKFLLGNTADTDNVFVYPTSYATTNYKFWMSSWTGVPDVVGVDVPLDESWREAEASDCVTIGSDLSIGNDAGASNGKYVTATTVSSTDVAPGKNGLLSIPIVLQNSSKFYINFRIKSPNATGNSLWVSIDDRPLQKYDVSTNGEWKWINILSEDLLAGKHFFNIGFSQIGTELDRISVTNSSNLPTGLGGVEKECSSPIASTILDFEVGNIDGWTKQNPGAGITITQEDKHGGQYALKMVNGTGTSAWSIQAFTPDIDINPGDSYQVSFWIRAVGGGGKGRISAAGSGGQIGGSYWANFDVGDVWTRLVFTNLTATGTKAKLSFDLGYVAGKTYYIDDIVIEDKNLITAIPQIQKTVDGYSLGQNYPNPSDGNTSISFEIPNSTYVSLKVYNTTGVEIAELAGKKYPQGKHTLTFDSQNLSQGIYIYVLHTDNYTESKKLTKK